MRERAKRGIKNRQAAKRDEKLRTAKITKQKHQKKKGEGMGKIKQHVTCQEGVQS